MQNISHFFGQHYRPIEGIVFYQKKGNGTGPSEYVERFPIDDDGYFLAGSRLTAKQAAKLSKALLIGERKPEKVERKDNYLQVKKLMPPSVLSFSHHPTQEVVWWTAARKESLLFSDHLTIPCGLASLPPLVWKASRESLTIFAMKEDNRPTLDTKLFLAPFFNIHPGGSVCMGDVDVAIGADKYMEDFIMAWETYFFNSYFSHLIADHSPVKGNIVDLWQGLVGQQTEFPLNQLTPTALTLKNLLHEKE